MNPFTKVIGGIAIAVILGLGIFSTYLYISRAHLQVEIANDQTLIASLKSANDDWAAKTAVANKALQDTIDTANKRAALAAKAVADAQAQAAPLLKQIASIKAYKAKGDDCAATKGLLDKFFATKK